MLACWRSRTSLGRELEEREGPHRPLAHGRTPKVVVVDAHPPICSALRSRTRFKNIRMRVGRCSAGVGVARGAWRGVDGRGESGVPESNEARAGEPGSQAWASGVLRKHLATTPGDWDPPARAWTMRRRCVRCGDALWRIPRRSRPPPRRRSMGGPDAEQMGR